MVSNIRKVGNVSALIAGGTFLLLAPAFGPLGAASFDTTVIEAKEEGDSGILPIDGNTWLAPVFETGAANTYISGVSFQLAQTNSASEDAGIEFTFSLHGLGPNGKPVATSLATTQLSTPLLSSGIPAVVAFGSAQMGDLGGYQLNPNSGYAFVLSNAALQPDVESGSMGLGGIDRANQFQFDGGFASAGKDFHVSTNQGTSWTPEKFTPKFTLSISQTDTTSSDGDDTLGLSDPSVGTAPTLSATLLPDMNTPATPVPAPLPILGLAAAFSTTRRIRNRISRQAAQPPVS